VEETAVVEPPAPTEPPAAAETAEPATNWLPYALFGLLVLLLGGGLLFARQRG
jgi:hypothetical protein